MSRTVTHRAGSARCCFFVVSGAGYANIVDLHHLLFPPTVSRAGRMSSASSHSESRSIKILTHRSRVLNRPIRGLYVGSGRSVVYGAGLRKRLRKAVTEQPADTSRSTARTFTDKGKGIVELEEVLEWGYTIQELCEVEDRAGADTYFASIMTQLRCADSEDPLVLRWSTISGSSQFWTEGSLSGQHITNERLNPRFDSIGRRAIAIGSHKNLKKPHDNRVEATRNRQHEQPPTMPATLNRVTENTRSMMLLRHDQLTTYMYKRGTTGAAQGALSLYLNRKRRSSGV
ncbi:hypothetical protein GW17_00032315 [Ensete ventricosum]|nr:hypothetical protein GW17_00032315 [Ensete ventricosum]